MTRDNNQVGLAQVIVQKGITWYPKDRDPVTIVGDSAWKDYDVEATIELPDRGYTSIYGRVGTFDLKPVPFPSYWVKCYANGTWEIGKLGTVLTKGVFTGAAKSTHVLRLCLKGSTISAELDGSTLGSVKDTSYRQGMAGIGCSLNRAVFDDFKVVPVD